MFFERLKYSTLTYTFSTAGVQEIRFRQCKDKKSFELLMKLSRGFINLISSVCSDCLVFFLIAVVFVLLGFFVMLQPNIGNNTETLFFKKDRLFLVVCYIFGNLSPAICPNVCISWIHVLKCMFLIPQNE